MPATPRKYTPRTPPWLIDPESGARLFVESEEEYLELMNAYMAEEYKGLSAPILGDDIYALKDPEWALKYLIQEDGLTILHGQPGSYKSFVAMDWAYSLAAPQATGWMGQPRAKQFRPMYLFTEGMSGLKNRSIAWSKERGIETPTLDDSVVWVRDRVAINATRDAENPFTQQVASLVKMYNDYNCNILFIDTLANTFVGNENMQEDANSYLRTLSLFLEGGPVVLIHHNKKGEDEFRGSTVFHGAVDTLVSMKKSDFGVKLSISKQKDGPETLYLNLKAVEHTWKGQYEEQSSIALSEVGPEYSTKLKAVHYEILELLAVTDMPSSEIQDATKVKASTVDSRLKVLVAENRVTVVEGSKPKVYTKVNLEEI